MNRRFVSLLLALVASTPAVPAAWAAQAPSAAPAGDAPVAAPPTGLVPRPSAPAPRAFTLEDRYLDAARRGDLAVLKLCLDKGVNPAAKDGFGRGALLLAARDGRSVEAVRFLQDRGLAVDEADFSGRAALAWAAGNADAAMVTHLLAAGADPKRRDQQGQTPLYNAVLAGGREAVLALLAAGCDVNARDNFDDTPLIGACAKGHDALARLLVEKGADPKAKDQEGRTARARAVEGATYCRSLPE